MATLRSAQIPLGNFVCPKTDLKMGAIAKPLDVRSESEVMLNLYFDSGSPSTFIKLSAAAKLGNVFKLRNPLSFSATGEREFQATHIIHLEVRLLDIWCKHLAYVVPDKTLAPEEDILVGHDFMQRYRIGLNLEAEEIVLDRNALLRAQKV